MTNPNDQAYPGQTCDGMTKRELFSAMAMQGILANSTVITAVAAKMETSKAASAYGEDSVKFADALIQALNKEGV